MFKSLILGAAVLVSLRAAGQPLSVQEAQARLKEKQASASTTSPASGELEQLRREVASLRAENEALKHQLHPAAQAATAPATKARRKWFYVEGKNGAAVIDRWVWGAFKADAARRAKEEFGMGEPRVIRESTREELATVIPPLDAMVMDPGEVTEFKKSRRGVNDRANTIAKGMTLELATDILGEPATSQKQADGTRVVKWRAFARGLGGGSIVLREVGAKFDADGKVEDFQDQAGG